MIRPTSNPQKPKSSLFHASIAGLSNVLGLVLAFFATPHIHASTSEWIRDFVSTHYWHEMADAAVLGWFVCIAALVFFLARAGLATGLSLLALGIASRWR